MRGRLGATVVIAALGCAAGAPAVADAAALTATGIRVGDHPAFVRVVVDLRGAPLLAEEVVATDPQPFGDGLVRLPVTRPGVRTTAAPVTAQGVRTTVRQGAGRIVIRLAGARRRFKYVSYTALHAPERLVIDLWKSAPPSAAAEVRRAPDGCLSLRRLDVTANRVTARGRELDLFEHSLVVRLRRAGGRIAAQRATIAAAGRWSTRFGHAAGRQAGTLEAVALSAKDGTLDCIVQVRVRIRGAAGRPQAAQALLGRRAAD
jgi:hypothetical protein